MYQLPLVYQVPGMESVDARTEITYKSTLGADLKMDICLPPGLGAGSRVPIVLFIHGGFIPKDVTFLPKDWGVYRGYGRLAAALGMAGVTFNHRYWGWTKDDMDRTFSDVLDAIRFVRGRARDYRLDPDRVALWAFSGGGPHLGLAVRERMAFVRCLVSFYAIFDLQPMVRAQSLDPEKEGTAELSLLNCLDHAPHGFPPIFIGRAGMDAPPINEAVDRFVDQALEQGVTLDLANHPSGSHGFDILDDDDRSREIIVRAFDFIRTRFGGTHAEPKL